MYNFKVCGTLCNSAIMQEISLDTYDIKMIPNFASELTV